MLVELCKPVAEQLGCVQGALLRRPDSSKMAVGLNHTAPSRPTRSNGDMKEVSERYACGDGATRGSLWRLEVLTDNRLPKSFQASSDWKTVSSSGRASITR